MSERGDTRSRIQDVALDLFTEQGYEATSLREIAERLGVTKAALYYHFRTKDDIVASLIADRLAEMDEMAAWLRGQRQVTVDTRREFIRMYAAALASARSLGVMRFLEANQASVKDMLPAVEMRDRMLEILDLLVGPEHDPRQRLRISMAIFALHASWVVLRAPGHDEKQRQEAALEVALSLVDEPPATDPGASRAG
jgi:AcrR family transcriptional regulator